MSHDLPDEILQFFLRRGHVYRHARGEWNSVFMDQFGEQTYIRYGMSKGVLFGKTLNEEQVTAWTFSHRLCNSLSLAYEKMIKGTLDDKFNFETSP